MRTHGELGDKFTFVDVTIRSTNTTAINCSSACQLRIGTSWKGGSTLQEDIVVSDLRNRHFPDFEITGLKSGSQEIVSQVNDGEILGADRFVVESIHGARHGG